MPELSIPFIVIYWAVMAIAVGVCGVAVYVLVGDWWAMRRTAPPHRADINARVAMLTPRGYPPLVRPLPPPPKPPGVRRVQ